jgi:hypothetical protein
MLTSRFVGMRIIKKHIIVFVVSTDGEQEPGQLSGIALGYRLYVRSSSPGRGRESSLHTDRFWGPPSLLSNGYQGLFPWR